uniref:NADH dehydrogenase subunit 2 n=1 Tax=Erianthus versicolor TaxID=470935 RepID=UPI0024118B32|nr:NADH dehydrogenase subunit 2 [Erianthus versicolor]WEL32782.1 NADH dehydrogenase subunit 2 [Erianthus versicolor]
MHKKTMSLLFLSLLVMGTALTVSSNSWLGVWVGLEINLMAFIPMMKSKNPVVNETSIKYFMIQAMASIMIMFSLLSMQSNLMMMKESMIMIILSSLLLKLGVAPFQFWFIEVMSMSSWMNCMILMTWQKIAPLAVMSYCLKNNIMMLMLIMLSIMIGGIGGLNHLSIRVIMSYSSVSHSGWMMSSMLLSDTMWELYFLVYSTMTVALTLMFNKMKVFHLNNLFNSMNKNKLSKYLLMLSFLSLGGLPPFLGFLTKWMIIQLMIKSSMTAMASVMVWMNMITLYYYMKILFSASIIMNTENKWSTKMEIPSNMSLMTIFNLINLGLMTSPILMFTM